MKKIFSKYAKYYDLLYKNKSYKKESNYIEKILNRYAGKKLRILELGCGSGGHAFELKKKGHNLTALDTSKKMIEKYWTTLIEMSETEHSPFEIPLHKIYKNELCLSPIPSLAMHCTNVNSVFGLSPNINWKKLWDENK